MITLEMILESVRLSQSGTADYEIDGERGYLRLKDPKPQPVVTQPMQPTGSIIDRVVCPQCGGWVDIDPNTGEVICCDTCDWRPR